TSRDNWACWTLAWTDRPQGWGCRQVVVRGIATMTRRRGLPAKRPWRPRGLGEVAEKGPDAGGRVAVEREGGELFRLVRRHRADDVFDGGYSAWGHAELADAKADEKRGGDGLGGELAAYCHSGPRGRRV